jgi:hypothetical protein
VKEQKEKKNHGALMVAVLLMTVLGLIMALNAN